MKRRARDNNHQVMIGINTWLFGVGALLVGYNAYKGLPLDDGGRQAIFANLTQAEALVVASFAIMMAGFFYSLVVLKPDMLMRNRERKLIALKADAGRHEDYTDSLTDLPNLKYFQQVMDSYLEESNALDETRGVLIVEVNAPSSHYKEAMINVAQALKDTARDYDVVAKIDLDKIAVLTPHIEANDLVSISNRFQTVLSGSRAVVGQYECVIGFAASNKEANKTELVLDVALKNLAVTRRLTAGSQLKAA